MAPFLRSSRLAFHPLEKSDARALVDLMNEAEVRRYLDARVFPLELTAEESFIESMSASAQAGTDFTVVVRQRDTDELVGATGLHDIHPVHRRAEWGIVLAPPHWSQGYGVEIARTVLEHAFSQLNLHSVHLRVRADHAAGIRCYEKAGFQAAGRLREAVYGDGRFHDQLLMSALRREWT